MGALVGHKRIGDKMKEDVFGYELRIELYGCKADLDSIDFCYNFLNDTVKFIKMKKQSEPNIVKTPKEFVGKDGLSGSVMLAESGIMIHTMSLIDYVTLNIYSCRYFNPDEVEEYVKKYWKASLVDSDFSKRGLNFSNMIKECVEEKN